MERWARLVTVLIGMRLNVFPIILQERGEIKDLWMFMRETFAC